MRKLKIIGIIFVSAIVIVSAVFLLSENKPQPEPTGESPTYTPSPTRENPYDIMAKRDLLALMMAYPGHIKGLEKGKDGLIYVVMQSGKKIAYDDKKTKSFEEKLANADLQDMMEQVYPLSDIKSIMKDNFDPGRTRVYAFLKEVYGSSQSEVEAHLTRVALGSANASFNENNHAAPALKAAFQEIAGLIKSNPDICGFVYPLGGTFNYRVIAGTSQLSPHAFGIAVDLKSDKRDYWRWATEDQGQDRLDSYPRDLVTAFENNGFIWGGKWAHFDILHYEYRPELIIKSKYYADPEKITGPWYKGYPDSESVQKYISIIETGWK